MVYSALTIKYKAGTSSKIAPKIFSVNLSQMEGIVALNFV
jgi:hypothetical protein